MEVVDPDGRAGPRNLHGGITRNISELNASCMVKLQHRIKIYAYVVFASPYLDCPVSAGSIAIRPARACSRSLPIAAVLDGERTYRRLSGIPG